MRELLSRRLPIFVGRDKERSLISETVTGSGRLALLILGDAGIGKTRLLEEVDLIVAEECKKKGMDISCLPILDFYDTPMHSGSAIEEAIVRNLAERGVDHAFEEFTENLVECREGRISEEQLWEAFKAGYDKVYHDRRIVLRFDTAELLEYEHDDPEVLEDCEVKGLEAPALGWLAEKAPQLQNTAIIIASRPDEDLRERLGRAYGENLRWVELGGLNLEETKEYFRQAGDFGIQVLGSSSEMVEKVWLLSDGKPIFVSLSLDWLRRGIWDERFYPVDVVDLRKLRKQGGKEWEEVKRGFRIALVQKIREWDTPLDKAAYYAARARKGCNAELLARMLEISDGKAEELILQFLELSFVKRPHILPKWRDEWFFLHDEMYDLVEEFVWQAFWPDYAEQERIAEDIISYYNGEIRQVKEGVKAARTERERSDLQHQRHILLTERLYYQFDLSPRSGQLEYDRLDTQAFSERALDWDNSLRIEAIRFARQRPERALCGELVTIREGKVKIADWINMNCRARWVYRFVARGEYEKAIEVAGKLLDKYPDADGLWQSRLLVARAAAEERLGFLDETEGDIEGALRLLDKLTPDRFDRWMVDYWRATAYIYEGLMARTLGELEKATEANAKAASLYRGIGYQPGEARALNNRAYILGRQAKLREALDDCEKALRIRQEIGDEYGIALGLNTLGVIKKMERDFRRVWTASMRALRLFQRRRDEVGIALANINLGWAYRRWGLSDARRIQSDVERYFTLSEKCLARARERENKLEPYYQLEIHNELGCTYKDWANFLALALAEKTRYRGLMERADEEFSTADDLATRTKLILKKADNLEDWAWAFHLRYAYRDFMEEENPEALLQRAKDKLNEAEKILEGSKVRVEAGLEPHLILGKVHYQHALLLAKFGELEEQEETARNYALAATYLETYSDEAWELEELQRSIEGWLSELSEDELGNLAEAMKEVLDEREREGWKCGVLRRWLDDVILGAPMLGLGRH
jgi:tetratricopeptide (TPR) repeat protein